MSENTALVIITLAYLALMMVIVWLASKDDE